eukprot:TRINITY_DN99_c0_g4_i1.p1 TRINITY_DN99_c0_g4~~TRINITY_DN99_c0_g4_i1.p1  ORF type:complete len:502 (+),score=160.20 TRINITY_DN99_c0_g4_i1:171-1676(+)
MEKNASESLKSHQKLKHSMDGVSDFDGAQARKAPNKDSHKRSASVDERSRGKDAGSDLPDVKDGGVVAVQKPDGTTEEAHLEETVSRDDRQGLMKTLTNALGLDITAITLPVTVNEPMSFLMRLAEMYQYTDLLDKANMCEDSIDRLVYVSAFVVSQYANAERTGKPFNPLLGETYEYLDDERDNLRFVAEQVSHHPPIGACHAENDNFVLYCSQQIKTKFGGNSLEASAVGQNYVLLKRTNETFKWHNFRTTVHNLLIGAMWFDHYGEEAIVNKTTGEKCQLELKKCGWFSKGWREVVGTVLDAKGTAVTKFFGKWNEGLHRLSPGGKPESSPTATPAELRKETKQEKKEREKLQKAEKKEEKKQKKIIKKGEAAQDAEIWVNDISKLDKVPNKFLTDWTEMSFKIVAVNDAMKAILPPTDSRLRADRAALEVGDTKTAASAKFFLEEKQRDEKRKRGTKEWTPRYFKKSTDSDGEECWMFTGTYWKEREERIDAYSSRT